MTNIDAIKWVDAHARVILSRVNGYTLYTPYSPVDYLQDAYEAAIKAVKVVNEDPTKSFSAVFMIMHRKIVFAVTPYPGEERKQNPVVDAEIESKGKIKKSGTNNNGGISMSYPANKRNDIPMENMRFDERNEDPIDLDFVYRTYVKGNLSRREAEVMEMALGLTDQGCHSTAEIGEAMGINGASVRKMITRSIEKTRAKVVELRPARYEGQLPALNRKALEAIG